MKMSTIQEVMKEHIPCKSSFDASLFAFDSLRAGRVDFWPIPFSLC